MSHYLLPLSGMFFAPFLSWLSHTPFVPSGTLLPQVKPALTEGLVSLLLPVRMDTLYFSMCQSVIFCWQDYVMDNLPTATT